MKFTSWSLFGVLSNGLKDNAVLQVQVTAGGEMELVSDKRLVLDDYDENSEDNYQMGLAFETLGSDGCRMAASDCRIASSSRFGNVEIKGTRALLQPETGVSLEPVEGYSNEIGVLEPPDMKALAAALDHCEAMCVKGFLIAGVVKQCTNFYFLKDAATGKESCRFYEIGEDVRAYIEDLGYHARSTDESKWNLCIWQPGSQFVGQKLPLCNAKVSRTPAEEAAEKAARVKAYYDRKAAEEAARQAAIDKEARELQEKAQEERLEFQGEVGERTQFRNKLQGKCLAALDGPSGNLTWSDCSDRSDKALWTMRADGSYESAAHPDRCPREGDGARSPGKLVRRPPASGSSRSRQTM